jgi:transcriptional regulator with GAF, ATPase, and Fis domain
MDYSGKFVSARAIATEFEKSRSNKEVKVMGENGKALSLEKKLQSNGVGSKSSAVFENRLEALKVLSNSILQEVEALRKAKNVMVPEKIDLAEEVQRFEVDLIRTALLRTGGKQRKAARLLNVKVTTLNAKIKRYGITANGFYEEVEAQNSLGVALSAVGREKEVHKHY